MHYADCTVAYPHFVSLPKGRRYPNSISWGWKWRQLPASAVVGPLKAAPPPRAALSSMVQLAFALGSPPVCLRAGYRKTTNLAYKTSKDNSLLRKMSRYDKGKPHKSTRRACTADVLIKRAHKAYEKYQQSGKKSQIHYAIELAAGAIRRAPEPPASWSLNLAHYLNSRYERFKRQADLDRAVLVARRGIAAAHEDNQGRSFLLNTLAALLVSRYTGRQAFSDLGRAIQAAENALASLPRQNQSAKPILLNTLASVWNHAHTHTGKVGPLNRAIQAAKDAASCATIDDPSQPLFLSNYLTLVNIRYTLQGEVSDLEEAISKAEGLIMYLSDDHPLKPELLNDLGFHLHMHHEHTKDVTELNKAVRFGSQAVELVANDSPRKAIYLGNLSNSLSSLHRLNNNRQDLERSIRLSEAAADAIPKGHESELEILHNLVMKRIDLYRWTGQNLGFESTVEEMRQCLATTPANHHAYAARLDDFAALLFLQFEKTGTLKYLNEAIKLSRRSMQMTPADHPDQSIYAGNVGYYYAHLYDSTQTMRHLDVALACTQVATNIAATDSIWSSTTLGRLGEIFERRYDRTGSADDLQKAIHFTTNAVDASPNASMEKAAKLGDLGTLLEKQYLRTGAILHLNEAIARSEEAIQITPRDHATLPGWLNNQAIKLIEHHSRTGLYHTIDEAFHHASRAVELTPRDHLDWAMYTSTLASVLHSRYELREMQEDLARAIDYERQARDAVPEDHVLRMAYQHNLGISLSTLYRMTSNEKYLSEAIDLIKESVESAPNDSPLQAERKNTLASLFETQYRRAKHTGRREEILRLALGVWNCTVAAPFQRIKAGYRALRMFAEELRSETQYSEKTSSATDFNSIVLHQALNLGVGILDLLPVVHTRYLERKDQQFVVSSFSGVASLTAHFFLVAGKISEAIECLERGRTVIINQLLSDRKGISELKQRHPALATKYARLVAELNTDPHTGFESSSTRRRDAVKELDTCIADMKAAAGSGILNLTQSVSEMQQKIGTRLVILVNVSDFGSHAIIFSSETLLSMKLPKLTASGAKSHFDKTWTARKPSQQSKANEELREALEWLWEVCVEPVLFEISAAPKATVETLPRVWWIGSGLASSLPFHAAGSHGKNSSANTVSRVVSSYTPSIMSLIHAIQHDMRSMPRTEGKLRLLLATMPTTPSGTKSYDKLQVAKEASSVLRSMGSHVDVEVLEYPDVEQVSKSLEICHVAHFACHGAVDHRDPSNTALLLQRSEADGICKQDPLTVQKISELRLESACIAYLSACSTAENRALNLRDEVLHLASGFLVGGFPNVIGSLWGANDSACAKLATYFYEQAFDESKGGITANVAIALHRATERLRNAQPKAPTNWAQFVHWGI